MSVPAAADACPSRAAPQATHWLQPRPDPKPDKLLGGGIDGQLRRLAAAASA